MMLKYCFLKYFIYQFTGYLLKHITYWIFTDKKQKKIIVHLLYNRYTKLRPQSHSKALKSQPPLWPYAL